MICNFKNPDGRYNIVEGPDEQGRVRIQCHNCQRLYPPKKYPPIIILPNETIHGLNCNHARRAQRLAQSAVNKTLEKTGERRGRSCPESCLLRAKHHQAALVAELNSVVIKAKDHELKAMATAMLGQATRSQVDEKLFKAALELAVKQALAEGREQSS